MDTFKATATRLPEGFQVEGEARTIKVMIDEPVEAGGTNLGMNPVEMLLCSLGGCQTIIAYMVAESVGVKLDGFRVELEGDLDMSDESDYNGFQEIRFTFFAKTDASQEAADNLAATIETMCPVGNTLKKAVNMVCKGIVIE